MFNKALCIANGTSVLVAVADSNGGHHPKVTRSMFSHPAMGGRHWRRPLQNITVQAEKKSGNTLLCTVNWLIFAKKYHQI